MYGYSEPTTKSEAAKEAYNALWSSHEEAYENLTAADILGKDMASKTFEAYFFSTHKLPLVDKQQGDVVKKQVKLSPVCEKGSDASSSCKYASDKIEMEISKGLSKKTSVLSLKREKKFLQLATTGPHRFLTNAPDPTVAIFVGDGMGLRKIKEGSLKDKVVICEYTAPHQYGYLFKEIK